MIKSRIGRDENSSFLSARWVGGRNGTELPCDGLDLGELKEMTSVLKKDVLLIEGIEIMAPFIFMEACAEINGVLLPPEK